MKKFKVLLKQIIDNINVVIMHMFYILPVNENMIVMESEGDYTDNVRVFYDYMIRNKLNEKYKIVWVVRNPMVYTKEKNVTFVARRGKIIKFRLDYYAAVSKFFVFSHPYWLKTWRPEQIVIHTTHSVAMLKATKKNKCKYSNVALVCSEYVKETRSEIFKLELDELLLLGMPRLDLMYEHMDCLGKLFPQRKYRKFILVMETFKQSGGWKDSTCGDNYAINVISNKEQIMELDRFLDTVDSILVIKIHHLQDLSFLNRVQLRNVYYITDKELAAYDIQVNQLLENADILLTDYSSVFYDYLLVDRPIGFLLGDIEQYSRGFIMENPFEEMPGEKIRTVKELISFLMMSISGEDRYTEERKEIRDKVFEYQDNKNCERLFNWMEQQVPLSWSERRN